MASAVERRFSLAGEQAIVIGASRGIGLAIARELAQAGAATTMVARDKTTLEREAQTLRATGFEAQALALDVTDSAALEASRAMLESATALFVVAGTNIRKPVADFDDADFDALLTTNLRPVFRLARMVGPAMTVRGGGTIVTVGSVTSTIGLPFTALYGATKSALAGLTRSLAAEWGRAGIRVNCIAPGFIATDMTRAVWQRDGMTEWLASSQALPRLGTTDDVVGLAVFLASRSSSYITGQVIAVDGGFTTTAVWPLVPGPA